MEKVIVNEIIAIEGKDEIAALKHVQDHLTLAGEELKRMEDEGGIPMNKEQAAKAEVLTTIGAEIGKALPTIPEQNPPSLYEI